LIEANQEIAEMFSSWGVNMIMTGGETADVGDLVRTVIVDTTVTARLKRSKVIDTLNIVPGDVIVGLASFGQASYENEYNAGMGSNGLTSARHDVFCNDYKKYPETFEPAIPENLVYSGPYKLTDMVEGMPINVGKAVLSPTRTYAPVIKKILGEVNEVHGIIHCTGGAQTKCLNFGGNNLHYIKDQLFDTPPLFKLIKEASGTLAREMYRVFNMGHRMELYVPEHVAKTIIDIAASFNIDAKIIGHVEAAQKKSLTIKVPETNEIVEYDS
jgi:phosphoribosylformylglycinamidine cyclo-ligase